MQTTLSAEDIRRTVQADYHDPFSLRGMHRHTDAEGSSFLVVRTVQPGAREVCVVPDRDAIRPVRMHTAGEPDLFEARFGDAPDWFTYTLQVHTAAGDVVSLHDPYAFPPFLSDYDLYLFGEGSHQRSYSCLGAHAACIRGVAGIAFAVWAPNARSVRVVGDFNGWNGRHHPMRVRGTSGIWELFIPGLAAGVNYKYEISSNGGDLRMKADPLAFFAEVPPRTASRVWNIGTYCWGDAEWMARRDTTDQLNRPIAVYEVHLGSWMRVIEEGDRPLTYREAALRLIAYVKNMGYTHIEFMPLAAHPFDPSWGYQVTGYYSPSPRYGTPEDLMFLIDQCHQSGIGVLMDWVPAHFPADDFALARFDGTCLYEHADPKEGLHPDWGTLVFNYGRNEVRTFLISNALFWLDVYHLDGLRVDAVASMLYRDYSRAEGEWVPNRYGGRENLEAIDFLKTLNRTVAAHHPGVLMIAEESTAWPGVSRPVHLGGLGFSLKWNMGWMHDMIEYISRDPLFRKYHHNLLTFALLYTFHENFILPFSHDEVVHGKGALMGKMPGYGAEQFANCRALLCYMYGHPGKKHLFMGIDLGQWAEWQHDHSIEWHLLDYTPHQQLNLLVRDLNRLYREEPALHELDFDHTGFEWIDFHDSDNSIVSFIRKNASAEEEIVCVYNFTPMPRQDYRVGVPREGCYREILNSDAAVYGGADIGNGGAVTADPTPWHGRPWSLGLNLPPCGCLMLKCA